MAISEGSRRIGKRDKEAATEAVNHYLYLQRSDITMQRKPTMPTPLKTTHQTTKSTSELQEQIRRRAYELFP